jgi:hypothetical protein
MKIARQMSFPFAKSQTRSRVTYLEPDRRNQIRTCLEEALEGDPPPTLHAVARSLKMSNSTLLREVEPELSRQLTEMTQSWKGKQDAAIRATFARALNSKVPVSLETFCKNRGISYSVVRRKYPDLKASYTARFRLLRSEAKKARSAQRQVAVAASVLDINRRGEYPSVGRVKSRSPELKAAGWDEIQAAIRAAELGPKKL